MTELYINGTQADVDSDFVVAVTKQYKLIEDFVKIQSDYTNTVDLKLTKNNARIFSNIWDVTCNSDTIYNQIRVDLFINGTAVIYNGFGVIEGNTEYTVQLTMYSTMTTFYEALKGKTLKTIGITDTFNFSFINIKPDTTTNTICYPVVDGSNGYGVTNASPYWEVDPRQLVPMLKVNDLIDYISTETGYTLEDVSGGDIADSDLLLALSEFNALKQPIFNGDINYSDDSVASGGFFTIDPATTYAVPIIASSDSNKKRFTSSTFNGQQYYTNSFIAPQSGTYTFEYKIKVSAPDGTTITVGDSSYTEDTHLVGVSGGIDVIGTLSYDMNATETGRFNISHDDVDDNATLFLGYGRGTSKIETYFTLIEFKANKNFYNTTGISIGQCLPDISVIDFLKEVCMLYQYVIEINERDKKVIFRTMNELYDNIDSGDFDTWDNKFIKHDSATTDLGWGQVSKFITLPDAEGNPSNLGNSSLAIDNKNIEKEKEIHKSVLAGSTFTSTLLTDTYINGICITNMWEYDVDNAEYNYQSKFKPRFFRTEQYNGTKLIKFDDGDDFQVFTTGNAYVAIYFNGIGGTGHDTRNIDYNTVLFNKYTAIRNIMNWSKKLTAEMLLSEADLNRDFLKPVYIDYFNSYFYVNKIINFVSGQPTKVELIKL